MKTYFDEGIMRVGNIISFSEELFFNGAVQLNWFDKDIELATKAAINFSFHGKEMHAISDNDIDEIGAADLKDTISFVSKITTKLFNASDSNPFMMAIAGYGTGKSHLALAIASLFSTDKYYCSSKVLDNITRIDSIEAKKIDESMSCSKKPVLIIAIDGMGNINLGKEFNKRAISQLNKYAITTEYIDSLSPHFYDAENFVLRNYENRSLIFKEAFGNNISKDQIVEALKIKDENIFSKVNDVFFECNGTRINIDGSDSPEDVIGVLCDKYCGDEPNKPFSRLLILFDEFGRYLEHAATHPAIANASALQQIYQGVQNNKKYTKFLSLIQYDLKAYLNQFNKNDIQILNRYISRFDNSDKYYLSSNLETLFAHLISKKDPSFIDRILSDNYTDIQLAHRLMQRTFPNIKQFSIWNNNDSFLKIIVKGSWPLHPYAVWFLSRMDNLVQNRSALSFVKDEIIKISHKPIDEKCFHIFASDIFLGSMFEEILKAEEFQRQSDAQTLDAIFKDMGNRLDEDQRKILAAIVLYKKLNIVGNDINEVNEIISQLCGLSSDYIINIINFMSNELAIVEWDISASAYSLIAGGTTRAEFTNFLRRKADEYTEENLCDFYINYDESDDTLKPVVKTDFESIHNFSTPEWRFETYRCTYKNFVTVIENAYSAWRNARDFNTSKGQLLYYFTFHHEDIDLIDKEFQTKCRQLYAQDGIKQAPLLLHIVPDNERNIEENFKKLIILNKFLSDLEKEKYQHFIPSEKNNLRQKYISALDSGMQRKFLSYVGELDTSKRLNKLTTDIFSVIYPKVISFPFDGFQTTRGNAAKDIKEITATIVSGAFDLNWLRAKTTQTKNRALAVLQETWQVLDENLSINITKSSILNPIFCSWDQSLIDTKLDLGQVFSSLLLPPYGCNSSSASLIIAVYLAKKTPKKTLLFQGQAYDLNNWLDIAYEGVSFKADQLNKTELILVNETDEDQFTNIMTEILAENNITKIENKYNDLNDLKNRIPIPNSLLDRNQLVEDKIRSAFVFVNEFRNFIPNSEDDYEKYILNSNYTGLIYLGDKVQRKINQANNSEFELPKSINEALRELLINITERIFNDFAEWIPEQTCLNATSVSNFNHKMEKYSMMLKTLGLEKLSDKVEIHRINVVQNIQKWEKYKTIIDETHGFINVQVPTNTDNFKKLNNLINKAEDLIEFLNGAREVLPNETTITNLIKKLNDRIKAIKDLKQQQKMCFNNIIDVDYIDLLNVSKIQDLIDNLRSLRIIFFGSEDDLEYLDDGLKQLEFIYEDFSLFRDLKQSREDFERKFNLIMKDRVNISEEMEYIWDTEELYLLFLKHKLSEYDEASKDWVDNNVDKTAIDAIKEISSFERYLSRFDNLPIFITEMDRNIISQHIGNIKNKMAEIKELNRQNKAVEWLESVQNKKYKCEDIASYKSLLILLEDIPEFLSQEDIVNVEKLKETINIETDKLDFNALIARVQRLSSERKRELLDILNNSNLLP